MRKNFLNLITLPIATLLSGCLLLIAASVAVALPDDNNQPIQIIADSAVKDDKLGLTIYEGNVSITQGSLNILADKVTLIVVNEEVTQMVALGKPARFKQKPELDEKDVVAKGNRIDYFIVEKKVKLTTNASLDQDGSVITGNTINYDINGAKAKAEGGVHVVIQPTKTGAKQNKPKTNTKETDQ